MTRPITTNYGSVRIGSSPAPRSEGSVPKKQVVSAPLLSDDDSFCFNLPSVTPLPAKETDAVPSLGIAEAEIRVSRADAAAGRSGDRDPEEVDRDGPAHTEAGHNRKPIGLAAAGFAVTAGLVASGWLLLSGSDPTRMTEPRSLLTGSSHFKSAEAAAPLLTVVRKERLTEEVGYRTGNAVPERRLAKPSTSDSSVASPLSSGDPTSKLSDVRPSPANNGASVSTTDRIQNPELIAVPASPPDVVQERPETPSLNIASYPDDLPSRDLARGPTDQLERPATEPTGSPRPAETALERIASSLVAPSPVVTGSPEPKVSYAVVPPGTPLTGPKELSSLELRSLMVRARDLINSGNIAAARSVLQRAAETQDKDAFFALAETYDPAALKRWGVIGIRADITLAQKFYELAATKGVRMANERLASLRP